jgi:hypothetical protein
MAGHSRTVAIGRAARQGIGGESDRLSERSASIDHRAFWARSLSRASLIAGRAHGGHTGVFQPGLLIGEPIAIEPSSSRSSAISPAEPIAGGASRARLDRAYNSCGTRLVLLLSATTLPGAR